MDTHDQTKQLQVGVAEETDGTLFRLELLVEAELIKMNLIEPLMKECEEKIFAASLMTAKRHR